MKKVVCFLYVFLCAFSLFAQDEKGEKKLWAKSVLNQKAPQLVVEKWLTEVPNTTGKFVLVDFWGPSCGPCRKSIPDLNGFSKEFKEDLIVIGMTSSDEKSVRAMKEPMIEYFSAIDTKNLMAKELEVKGYPHAILIDPRGIVRWEGFPLAEGYELTSKVIYGLIGKYKLHAKSYLNQKAPAFVVEKWLTEKPNTEGKFVLIDFWGPTCSPCVKSIPDLNRFSREFKEDLVIIGIAPNPEELVRKMKEPVIEYYSAIDTRRKSADRMSEQLNLKASPHAILIDPKGIVRWEGNPLALELTSEEIKEIITKYK